ncbi:MAG: nitroreductase family protein [Rhizobacter sp.]
MNTLTKLALGLIGQLKPLPPSGCATPLHALRLVVANDARRVTRNQDFVDTAPLDLVFVADQARMKLVPATQRTAYAHASVGAMAQNVYLYCASEGLATVIRAWFDRDALARAMGLQAEHQLLLAQTVGAIKMLHAVRTAE